MQLNDSLLLLSLVQLFMSVSWVIIGVMFMLCYFNLPSAEDQYIYSTLAASSINKLDLEDELDDKSVGSESDRMSNVSRMTFEKSYEVLEIGGMNGVARVVPYIRRNSVSSEASALSRRWSSTLLVNSSDYLAVEESYSEADNETVRKSCCHRLCSASRRLCIRLLWGVFMLLQEEIVLLLYIIFIMIFCEMVAQVRNLTLISYSVSHCSCIHISSYCYL